MLLRKNIFKILSKKTVQQDASTKKPEKSLLEKLADTVHELYLKAQAALPIDKPKANALYRKAYLAYHAHKLFVSEQEALLLTVIR